MVKDQIAIRFILLICLFLFFAGCSNDFQESFTFTGIVEALHVEEELIVIKEYSGIDEGRREGSIYEIPSDNVESFTVGQKLKVIVYSNIDEDIWDLDHMKFDLKTVED